MSAHMMNLQADGAAFPDQPAEGGDMDDSPADVTTRVDDAFAEAAEKIGVDAPGEAATAEGLSDEASAEPATGSDQDGALLTVSEAKCRYRAPARFNDEIRVLTKVLELRSRTIRFGYEIRRDADRRLLATGETLHTICGRDGKMMRLPEKYRPYFPLTNGEE